MICLEVTHAGWIPMLQNLRQNFLSPNLQFDLPVPQERFQDQIFPSPRHPETVAKCSIQFHPAFNADLQELRKKYGVKREVLFEC